MTSAQVIERLWDPALEGRLMLLDSPERILESASEEPDFVDVVRVLSVEPEAGWLLFERIQQAVNISEWYEWDVPTALALKALFDGRSEACRGAAALVVGCGSGWFSQKVARRLMEILPTSITKSIELSDQEGVNTAINRFAYGEGVSELTPVQPGDTVITWTPISLANTLERPQYRRASASQVTLVA